MQCILSKTRLVLKACLKLAYLVSVGSPLMCISRVEIMRYHLQYVTQLKKTIEAIRPERIVACIQ